MTWIETWTGRLIYPLDPKPDQICFEDIAHGLSHQCRYNGLSKFYTVAEHSVHLANWCLQGGVKASREITALHALLHDAAEAYLPDVPSPIKPLFPEFKKFEDRLQGVILIALGVRPICPWGKKAIGIADKRILINERQHLFPNHKPGTRWAVDGDEPLENTEIFGWPPGEAYDNFVECYKELTCGFQSIST